VASVLISDPDPETRTLLELLLRRLGHRPLDPNELANGEKPTLLIVEPAAPASLRQARALQRRLGQLPIVCVSIEPAGAAARALQPASYLIKPVRRAQLEQAINDALRSPHPAERDQTARLPALSSDLY
jgi:CheY-like chemotaxis protein